MTRVALLGTGIMGGAIARHLATAGHDVTVWNRTREKADPLAAHGCAVADDPAAAVRGAHVVLTMLADGPTTRVAVEAAGLEFGGVDLWVQMATVGVAACDDLAALAERLGVAYVDAPVLGSKDAAEAGQLLVLGSGPEEWRESAQELLAPVARGQRWLGPAGQASRMKLVANSWVVGMTALLGETVGLADALGLDPASFLKAIEGGPLDSGYAQTKGATMLARHYPVQFPVRLAGKDARLCVEAAAEQGVRLRVLQAAADDYAAAADAGHGEEDMAAVREAITTDSSRG